MQDAKDVCSKCSYLLLPCYNTAGSQLTSLCIKCGMVVDAYNYPVLVDIYNNGSHFVPKWSHQLMRPLNYMDNMLSVPHIVRLEMNRALRTVMKGHMHQNYDAGILSAIFTKDEDAGCFVVSTEDHNTHTPVYRMRQYLIMSQLRCNEYNMRIGMVSPTPEILEVRRASIKGVPLTKETEVVEWNHKNLANITATFKTVRSLMIHDDTIKTRYAGVSVGNVLRMCGEIGMQPLSANDIVTIKSINMSGTRLEFILSNTDIYSMTEEAMYEMRDIADSEGIPNTISNACIYFYKNDWCVLVTRRGVVAYKGPLDGYCMGLCYICTVLRTISRNSSFNRILSKLVKLDDPSWVMGATTVKRIGTDNESSLR